MQDPRASVRAAGPSDIDSVTACLTSAFFEDPVWGDWAFPARSSRAPRLARLLRFWTQAGMRHPWVRITPGVETAAVWIPPGEPELSEREEAAVRPLLDELFGARAGEVNDLFEQFETHHPRAEPHYYLSLWGTHRDHAGRGIGTGLITENLARIDVEQMPAYLESTNPRNLPRYEALGFERRDAFGPRGGPVITTMWRPPRSAAVQTGVGPSIGEPP